MRAKLWSMLAWWVALSAVAGFVLVMLVGAFFEAKMPPWLYVVLWSCGGAVGALLLCLPSRKRPGA